jgi:hypothetical protein
MGTLSNQIFEKIKAPSPREVWQVKNEKLTMDGDRKKPVEYRPVLVVSHDDLSFPGCQIVNVIPLSTSGSPDTYRFPVYSGFTNIETDFNPDKNSLALLKFYQPIKYSEFGNKCCTLDETTYEALKITLCVSVIGAYQFDLDI